MRTALMVIVVFLLSSAAYPNNRDPFKDKYNGNPNCDCPGVCAYPCQCKSIDDCTYLDNKKRSLRTDPFKITSDPFLLALADAKKPKKVDACICACGCPETPCECAPGECQCKCGCKPQICTEKGCKPGKACKCGPTECRPSWASDPQGEGYYLWRGELQLGYLYPSGKYRAYDRKHGWGKLLSKPPIPAPTKSISDIRQIPPTQHFQMRSVGC